MYGSGVVIGKVVTVVHHKPIPPVLHPGLSASFVVAVGAASRGAAVSRFGTAVTPAAGAPTSAYVWLVSLPQILFALG